MGLLTSCGQALSARLGRNTRVVSTLRPLYNRLLDFLYAESGMVLRLEGETVSVCPRSRNFAQVESDVYAYLDTNIDAGDTVIDVGAFVGIYAIISSRRVGPQGRVFAFEPTSTSLAFLHRHLVMNGVQGRVRVLACAAGRRSGIVDFYEHPDAYLNFAATTNSRDLGGERVRVPIMSIDEACSMFDLEPDLIRIDVQGLEADVLRGAAQTIRRRPSLKIVLEVHPQLWSLHGLNEELFRSCLADLDLNATALDGRPAVYFPDAHIVARPAARQA